MALEGPPDRYTSGPHKAIDIADLHAVDDMFKRIGDATPARGLFRAIRERWSVVADATDAAPPADLPPFGTDLALCLGDAVAAIQKHILALGERFVCMDSAINLEAGWGRFPLYWTPALIGRFPGYKPVLFCPVVGASCDREDELRLAAFYNAAAGLLKEFRYVYAGHVCAVHNATLRKSMTANWADPAENLSGNHSLAIYEEEVVVNGRTLYQFDYDNPNRGACPTLSEAVEQMDCPGGSTVAGWVIGQDVDAITGGKLSWGLGNRDRGIVINSLCSAEVSAYAITRNQNAAVDDVPWGVLKSFAFSVDGMPDYFYLANPTGYLPRALLVYCPAVVADAQREQDITKTRTKRSSTLNGLGVVSTAPAERRVLREVSSMWLETRRETWDESAGRCHLRGVDFSGDGTRMRVYEERDVEEFTGRGVEIVRRGEVDTFGRAPSMWWGPENIGDVAPTIEIRSLDLGLVEQRKGVFVQMAGNAKMNQGKVPAAFQWFDHGAKSDIHPADILSEAESFFEDGTCEYVSIVEEAGCRIVPILDFGEVFVVEESDELDNWAGLDDETWSKLHPPKQEEES